jgi:hypothetical protein
MVLSRRSGYSAFWMVSAASARLLMLMPERSLKDAPDKTGQVEEEGLD